MESKTAPSALPDDQARQDARFCRDRSIVVQAGAGTGKTTLLTDRILFTLVSGQADLGSLVALTFTEKAAGEIKLRLAARLSAILGGADPGLPGVGREEVLAAAGKALAELDRAHIGTIHHFAAQILRLYPIEAGVDPNFEVDSAGEAGELFDAEWARWLDVELGERAPRRREWLELLEGAGLEDLEAVARALCRDGVGEAALGLTPALREELSRLIDSLRDAARGKPSPGGRSKILDVMGRAVGRLEALAEGRIGPLETIGSSVWPKAWEGLPGRAEYERAVAVAAEVSAASDAFVRRAAEHLAGFATAFRARLARQGWVSFDGLVLKTRNLLRENLEVREALKARFKRILVDEFQDTDPAQGELLLYLAEKAGGRAADWSEIVFEPGKLFVVGDPKQSIYRFRGADIRAFEGFVGRLKAQGALVCDLRSNFRSVGAVIEPVNAVFSAVMGAEPGLQPAYSPIVSRRSGPGGASIVAIEGDLPAGERQAAEAAWIAEKIARDGRALKDCALLFRTGSPVGIYLEALKERGLPYAVESDRAFYGAQEVIDFINLLRALEDPSDRLSLAGLLRSPAGGLSDRELYALAASDSLSYLKDPEALKGEARAHAEGLFATLRRLRARVGREPLGEFMARVLRESFLLEHAAAAYHGDQTVSNLLKLARLAEEESAGRGATLGEFISRARRALEDSVREGESPLADEHLDAVRVLTMHKSKGLEYPVVFLPNLSAKRGGGGQRPTAVVDWRAGAAGLRLPKAGRADAAMVLIERSEKEREEREAVRLLYVAMTRAKDEVYLLGAAEGGDRTSLTSTLAAAGAWPDPERKPGSLRLGGFDVPVHYIRAGERPKAASASRKAAPPVLPRDPAGLWKRRWAERDALAGATLFVAPSRLEPAGEKVSWRDEEGPGLEAAARVGRLCHGLLEQWDFGSERGLAEALARVRAALEAQEGGDWTAEGDAAEKILTPFLKSPAAAWLRSARLLGRELPFVLGREGRVLRGAIDAVVEDESGLWAVDYKTGAGSAEAYREQGRAYADAVRKATGRECGFKVIWLRKGIAETVALK